MTRSAELQKSRRRVARLSAPSLFPRCPDCGADGERGHAGCSRRLMPDMDGVTYEPTRDRARLTGQLAAVYRLMRDGRWRTLYDISVEAGGSEASVSARLRDLRKPQFGRYTVERRNVGGGLWEYRIGGEG